MQASGEMGTKPIGQLLLQQALPASVGILVLSVYLIVDTIFVGRYVGQLGIAAISVVVPIAFLVSAVGMAIGVGGASIISRALGAGNQSLAQQAFGNQILLMLSITALFVFIGFVFEDALLKLFGANGDILPFAQDYFRILLPATPLLGWALMSNNVLRAIGKPKAAMMALLVPAVVNLILDPIFIALLGWGMKGAAWATVFGYIGSAGFMLYYFLFKPTEVNIKLQYLRFKAAIVKEISALGGITLARQGMVAIFTIVLNQNLFTYGGETAVAVYGIINRIMLFVFFPVFGITQGFLPIAGYNFGAQLASRVRLVIKTALLYGTGIASIIYVSLLYFAPQIAGIFTIEPDLIEQTPFALRCVFFAAPVLTLQLIGSAYFQAIGKALPALLLTLTRQGFILIPLLFILPLYFGLNGIWFAFPLSDLSSALITAWYLNKGVKSSLKFEES